MVQINVGNSANDNTGDTLRAAFIKVNDNYLNPIFSTDITVNNVKVGKGGGSISTNVILGVTAGISNTTGYENTFIGFNTGVNNVTGFRNTFLGLSSGLFNSSGRYNLFAGTDSGRNNTVGSVNTFLGNNSGINNSTGEFCTFVGGDAGSFSNYSNASSLGYNSQVTASNQVQLGDSFTTTYVYGTVQNRSDLRDKTDVQDTILGLDFISKLRPVDYRWNMREDYKTERPIQGELSEEDFKIEVDLWLENNKLANLKQDGSKKRNRFHHGFIAQEVRDLGIDFGGFQDHSISGGEDVLSIGYDEFIAPMIKAIQELKAEIEILKAK